jgi:hypothetical protein
MKGGKIHSYIYIKTQLKKIQSKAVPITVYFSQKYDIFTNLQGMDDKVIPEILVQKGKIVHNLQISENQSNLVSLIKPVRGPIYRARDHSLRI